MPLDLLGKIGSSGVRGRFRADVVVDSTGEVAEVRVVESLGADVDERLVAALEALTFSPARLDGAAVVAVYPVRYDFTAK